MSRFTGFLQRVKEMISESCGLRLLFNNEDNKYWYHNTVRLSHKPLNKWHCENKFPFISSSVLIVCVQSLCSKHKVIWISRGSPRSLGTNEDISISRSSVVVAPHLCFCVGWQFILLCLESTCSGDFQGWYMRRVKGQVFQISCGWTCHTEEILNSQGCTYASFLTCICRAGGFFPPLQSECISLITADDVLTKCHVQFLQNILRKGTVIVSTWKPIFFFIFYDILALSSSLICAFICFAC